jgi:FKBP-type peptidyl-prolyl cis-trans isomerase SlyD
MQIEKDRVVALRYVLRDDAGTTLDESAGESLFYLHGHGNLVPGLEEALLGKGAGEKFTVSVPPEKGYGTRRPELVFEMQKSELPTDVPHQKGTRLRLRSPEGGVILASITKVKLNSVELDGNHPLSDKTLHFEIEVEQVRKATKDELQHGHAHGPGNHHH